jgi:hypothetical protein
MVLLPFFQVGAGIYQLGSKYPKMILTIKCVHVFSIEIDHHRLLTAG